jgi:hypothetical protein
VLGADGSGAVEIGVSQALLDGGGTGQCKKGLLLLGRKCRENDGRLAGDDVVFKAGASVERRGHDDSLLSNA